MLNYIDNYLNRTTMYRLVLDFMFVLTGAGIGLSFFGVLPFKPWELFFTFFVLQVLCWAANMAFAKIFKVPANVESVYITGFILALIITPAISFSTFYFLLVASIIAMGSKYILVWKGKHIFNPAALAVVFTFFVINQGASWWVGNMWMLPVVAVGGVLILRKIQRFQMVLTFLVVALLALTITSPSTALITAKLFLLYGPIIFFATIMFTEPATSPTTRNMRFVYAAVVGLMFSPLIHIGEIYITPEIALLVGNIFTFIVSPKGRYIMTLKSKQLIGDDTYELLFRSNRRLNFQPGQYLEWTLPAEKNTDRRGNRRYFTIASAPSERDVRLGVKFFDNSSSFKKSLFELPAGGEIMAGQLAGDFVLPKDISQKLVFMAGGIGITPFRSMLKSLIDRQEKRDIIIFYSNHTATEAVYRDILDQAKAELGIKVIEIVTEKTGRLTTEFIQENVTDLYERTFLLSGPVGMVHGFQRILREIGVSHRRIRVDNFVGYDRISM